MTVTWPARQALPGWHEMLAGQLDQACPAVRLLTEMFSVAQTEQVSDNNTDSDSGEQDDDRMTDQIIAEKQAFHDALLEGRY